MLIDHQRLDAPTTGDGGSAPRELVQDQFMELTHRMRQFVRQQSAHVGLSLLHARVVAMLVAGGPQPACSLADRVDVDPANLTGVIDRLEQRGLVRREPHPTDRRVKLIVASDQARSTWQELRASALSGNPLVNALDDDELGELSDLLAKVLDRTDPKAMRPPGA